jgi:hypothetical protein
MGRLVSRPSIVIVVRKAKRSPLISSATLRVCSSLMSHPLPATGRSTPGAVTTDQSLVLPALMGTVGLPSAPVLLLQLVSCPFLGALLLTGVLLSTRIERSQAASRSVSW